MSVEDFDYLIDGLRALSCIQHGGNRWVSYAQLVLWMQELVRLNGPLMRPYAVRTDVQTGGLARSFPTPLAPAAPLAHVAGYDAPLPKQPVPLVLPVLEEA